MGLGFSIQRKYGWKLDKIDERDRWHNFNINKTLHTTIREVDLRKYCPEVYDQLTLGSCTANAVGAAYEFDQIIQKDDVFMPSRLFIYYNERDMENTINEDSGASIRDSVKSISKYGVCNENDWVYDVTKYAERPLKECYDNALHHVAIEYKRVEQDLAQLKQALIEGFPVVFGFVVYESFEGEEIKTSGIMKMPEEHEKILGGHAVLAVGFSDEKQSFLVRNSWGSGWGLEGYFWMPFEYITNPKYASDFWTVTRVRDDKKCSPHQQHSLHTQTEAESESGQPECDDKVKNDSQENFHRESFDRRRFTLG